MASFAPEAAVRETNANAAVRPQAALRPSPPCSWIVAWRRWHASPQLPKAEAHGLRIGFARGFGDHALVVEAKVGAAPQAQAHAGADPERIRHVVLADSINASFAA